MVFRRKPLVILKEQNMTYHPIVLSQFSIFWRKLSVGGGGRLNSINNINDSMSDLVKRTEQIQDWINAK